MEETTNNKTLEELQQDLINQIGSGELTDVESEAVRAMFDSVNKAIAEKRKAENELARIEVEEVKAAREAVIADKKLEFEAARAAKDAEVAELRSKNELKGNAFRAAGQVGGAIVAGIVSLIGVGAILYNEDHDHLVLSKAMGWVLKPRG